MMKCTNPASEIADSKISEFENLRLQLSLERFDSLQQFGQAFENG
jgi:hypothetical protein